MTSEFFVPWSSNLLAMVMFAIIGAYALAYYFPKGGKEHFDQTAHDINDWCMGWLTFVLHFLALALFFMLTGILARSDKGVMEFLGPLGTILLAAAVGQLCHMFTVACFVATKSGVRRVARYQLAIASAVGWLAVLRSSVGGLVYTIPAAERFGLKKKYPNFVLPFGATVNMDGTSVFLAVGTIAALNVFGIPLGWSVFLGLMMAIISASVGTAAAPSASLILMAAVIQEVAAWGGGDVGAEQASAFVALIIAIDAFADAIRTAGNGYGDLHCALYMNDSLELTDS